MDETMEEHYLLYIDVLGFEEMVENEPHRIDDLFEIIASLNLHEHGTFSTIVFSDTVLIHNVTLPTNDHNRQYIVMYQCEFFRDLLHRVAGRSIALRSVLTHGGFQHYLLNGVPYFYGPALNRAYRAEKQFQITGLLLDQHCSQYNRIFHSRRYDDEWRYVFVTQALDELEPMAPSIPLPRILVGETDLGWLLGPELEVLAFSSVQARSHADPRVREKHSATLAQYRAMYPECFAALESVGFEMEKVSSEFDWTKVRQRMHESYSSGSIRRAPLPGSQVDPIIRTAVRLK